MKTNLHLSSLATQLSRQRKLEDLRERGVKLPQYVSAGLAARPGVRLPRIRQQYALTQALLKEARSSRFLPPPVNPPTEAIILGQHSELKVPVAIHRDRLTENLLVIGSVGSGKTSYLFGIIDQLLRQKIRVVFYDFKGESPRLLNVYG
jgi:hypothetical protein